MAKRYILVGGQPFTGYTGSTQCTGLSIRRRSDDLDKIRKLWTECYEESGGLMIIIDCRTGDEVNPGS